MLVPLSSTAGSAPGFSASHGIATPAGWRREPSPGPIQGAGSYTVALPPELTTVPVTGTDSFVSEYRSRSLRLVFDFGPFGSSGVKQCRHHSSSCSMTTIAVDGTQAGRVAFYEADPDGGLPYRVDYTIPIGSPRSRPLSRIRLTIRAECATARDRALADRIVRTIDILPDR